MGDRKRSRAWILTLNEPDTNDTHNFPTPEELHKFLSPLYKKFIFQLERGEDAGRLHYQIFLYSKNAKYFNGIKQEFNACGMIPHIEIANNSKQAYNYCCKPETRVDGPWENGEFTHKLGEVAKIDKLKRELIAEIEARERKELREWLLESRGLTPIPNGKEEED